jgi:hypothetical protein
MLLHTAYPHPPLSYALDQYRLAQAIMCHEAISICGGRMLQLNHAINPLAFGCYHERTCPAEGKSKSATIFGSPSRVVMGERLALCKCTGVTPFVL